MKERDELYRKKLEDAYSKVTLVTVPIRQGHLDLIASLCDATNSRLEDVLRGMLEDSIEAAKDHFEYDTMKFLEGKYLGYAATRKGV